MPPISRDFYGEGFRIAAIMSRYAPYAMAETKFTRWRPGEELAASDYIAVGFLQVKTSKLESGTC